MARDWNQTFNFWGAPPSKTEGERCSRAELAVRKAIAASSKLSSLNLAVFIQGSYANGTNVRQDSDVDICVLYKASFYDNYSHAQGLSRQFFGFTTGTYPYADFKDEVGAALVSYFESKHIRRGKKAFDVRENTYRVDADVVPCFEYRLYGGNQQSYWHHSGTQLIPDGGEAIVNWPKQNKDNGDTKDIYTNGEFKAVTRVLKNLRFELMEEGDTLAGKIPSYLIECLVHVTPDEHLTRLTRYDNVRNTIAWLWENTQKDETCQQWTEVNGIKFLFRSGQPWSRADVNAFLVLAWKYIGFE